VASASRDRMHSTPARSFLAMAQCRGDPLIGVSNSVLLKGGFPTVWANAFTSARFPTKALPMASSRCLKMLSASEVESLRYRQHCSRLLCT
jgi:hypothetical protein